MIDNIFISECVRRRQKQAPLLRERELFLSQLLEQGCHLKRVRSIASTLLQIMRIMELQQLRQIDPAEVIIAGERWANEDIRHIGRPVGHTSAMTFSYIAAKWFRFHNVLILPAPPAKKPYDDLLDRFTDAMRSQRGLATTTLREYRRAASRFLEWCADQHLSLFAISLDDVDRFFDEKRAKGCCPATLVAYCNAVRAFFRYAEGCGWCRSGICQGILRPRISPYRSIPSAPSWKDVRRLLKASSGSSLYDLRAQSILYLCSIYALRCSEIVRLRLDDFDWFNETLIVRRSKRGRVQQFPIQYEVGEAILRYLRYGRPRCACRNLFVTVHTPYRPLCTNSVGMLVARRMKQAGILARRAGPHSLRHACATELLRKGSSLKNIADFLGHHDTKTVSIYARYDPGLLRKVCAFSLAGIQ